MQKQENNPGLFHQANIQACFIRVLLALPLPAIQIPLLDGMIPINVSLSRSGESCFGARGVSVCVCEGGGAGYVKIVMTGMCGPNFSYKLT